MKLKIKFLEWSAGLPVVMIREDTAKKLGVNPKDRIFIKSGKMVFSTIVDTIKVVIGKRDLVVSSELKQQLNLKRGQKVNVSLAPMLKSTQYIKKKLMGEELSEEEIYEIIRDVVINSLSEVEIGFFVAAMYKNGMNMKETFSLVKAIYETGNKITFKEKYVVDKHCIGGIPGNRTTPIVVSICAAAGLIVPKSSSRAITSAAGTADVIETVAPVEFPVDEMKRIIQDTNACMVWGGTLGMVTADAKIIQMEKVLGLDPQAQMIASIMAKKLAMGSKYILIDIPYGEDAKVTKKEALDLKQKFEFLGKKFGKHLKCVLTDGRQPIGNGIGPTLEMVDVLKVLEPSLDSPKDLEEKSLFLAGEILEMTGKVGKGQGKLMARDILHSGKALEKFKQIIRRQGGDFKNLEIAKFEHHILAEKSGKISKIKNKKLAFLSRILGCPADKSAGIYLYHHLNEKVKKGEKLFTLYSESGNRLQNARDYCGSEEMIIVN